MKVREDYESDGFKPYISRLKRAEQICQLCGICAAGGWPESLWQAG